MRSGAAKRGRPGEVAGKSLGSPNRTGSTTSLSQSFAKVTRDYSIAIRAAIIAYAVIAIFLRDIYTVGADAIGSDYYNYVLVIPFLSAYLIYRERHLLAAVMTQRDDDRYSGLNTAVGVSALAVAVIVYLYGSGTTYTLDYHILALEIFVGASVLLLFNRRSLRLLGVPMLLFLAALPYLTEFGLSFWLAMSWLSVIPAQWILAHVVGLNVVVTLPSPNIPTLTLTTSSGIVDNFAIGVASSGVYSVAGFVLIIAFLGYIARGSLWKKVLLFVIAFPLLLVVNILREVILVGAANLWGVYAFNIFHATSGIVLVFIVTFALLVIGDRVLKLDFFPARRRPLPCALCDDERKREGYNFCANCGRFLKNASRKFSSADAAALAAILIVTLVLVATLAPAVTSATAPTKVPIQTISGSAADSLLPQIHGWNLTFVERDTYVQDALEQDAALVYTYSNFTATNQNGSSKSVDPIVINVAIQVAAGAMHTPEASLISYPVLFGRSGVDVLTDNGIQVSTQPYLLGKYFVYQQKGSTVAYIYWITRAAFSFGSYSDFRNVEISVWQNTTTLAQQGAIPSATDLSAIQQLLLPLARTIALFWQPLSSDSTVQLIFAKWSEPLLGLAVLPAFVVGGRSLARRSGRDRGALARGLTGENRSFLESAKQARRIEGVRFMGKVKKVGWPTVERILSVHEARTGEAISPLEATKRLTFLEHVGLVRSAIVPDASGEPLQVWKS